jgi:parvulin-like peptidyl-prolyl isomerase
MSRNKNDGKGRLGGRAKGTPNRVTATVKEWLSELIDNNRKRIENDIELLEPKDRLQIMERLMQYVIPKQQAVKADIDLNKLSDEEIDNLITDITKGLNDGE